MLERIKIIIAATLFVCLVAGFGFAYFTNVATAQVTPTGHDEGSYLQKYSTFCAAKPAQESERWGHDFWCEFKVTDFVIAIFSAALVFVTAGLLGVGFWQNKQLSRQIKLSRDEFISTNRPCLRLRQFEIDPVLPDHGITVRFSVINVGNTVGTLTRVSSQVVFWNGKSFEPEINPVVGPFGPKTIRNGQRVSIRTDSTFTITAAQVEAVQMGGLIICVVGEFTYTDALGTERRTGFRRNYSISTDMFEASTNKDQEYED